jgi:hypothetical protein
MTLRGAARRQVPTGAGVALAPAAWPASARADGFLTQAVALVPPTGAQRWPRPAVDRDVATTAVR